METVHPIPSPGPFQALLDEFAGWATACGYPVTAYDGAAPRHFLALPEDHQRRVHAEFSLYVDACRDVLSAGAHLANDQVMFWAMLRRLGLRPLSTFLSDVQSGDIIEIHNQELVQIFRTLGFLRLCSHPLDDLLCRPFFQLFRREGSKTNIVLHAAQAALENRVLQTQRVDTGVHTIDEVDSPMMLRSIVENQVLSPLFDAEGRVGAIVTTIRCHAQDRLLKPRASSRPALDERLRPG